MGRAEVGSASQAHPWVFSRPSSAPLTSSSCLGHSVPLPHLQDHGLSRQVQGQAGAGRDCRSKGHVGQAGREGATHRVTAVSLRPVDMGIHAPDHTQDTRLSKAPDPRRHFFLSKNMAGSPLLFY